MLFLPETHRGYAGDGSVPQHGIYLRGSEWLGRKTPRKEYSLRQGGHAHSKQRQEQQELPPRPRFSWRTFKYQFELLLEKDVLVTLLFGSVVYTVWSMVTASTSSLFKEEFRLSDVYIGLIFLPNGMGCVVGSYVTGVVMDWQYKAVRRKFHEAWRRRQTSNAYCIGPAPSDDSDDFPLERARLRPMWITTTVFIVAVGAYGWTMETHIAVPLTLQFLISFTATAVFNINSTMIIDLYPSKPASATAIVRQPHPQDLQEVGFDD